MSSVDSEILMPCAACGASIYREHIHRGLAGMWAGQMLCPACLRPKRESGVAEPTGEAGGSIPFPLAPVEGADADASIESASAPQPETASGESAFVEASIETGAGARHVRTFHAKLSEAALRHLDEQVNSWLKDNPTVKVKFANTTVGLFEGKHSEPNLVLTVFY